MADEILPPSEDEATLAARVDAAKTADPAPVGPYQRPDDQLLDYLAATFREAWDHISKHRPNRELDWKFYAGDQWEAADKALALRQKRPALTLNMLLSIISAVEGEERTNRQEIKFYGTGAEDDGAAYGLNRLLKWVFDGCGGEFSLSEAFRSNLICGEGWVVPDMDFFDDPEGLLKILAVPDTEMFDDPFGTSDPTSATSRYCHRVRYMTDEEGEARFPAAGDFAGFRVSVQGAHSLGDGISETDAAGYRDIYSTPNDQKSLKTFDAKRKLWAVNETWWHQIEPGWVVVDDATGLLVEMTDEEFEGAKVQRAGEQKAAMQAVMSGQATFAPPPPPLPPEAAALGMMPPVAPPTIQMPPPLQAKQRPIKRFYVAFWCGKALLSKMASPLKGLKRIPYVPIRGLYDRVEGEWFGLIRSLIDAQRQHNTEQSVIVQLTQLMPKQAWMGPKGSFHNKPDWQTKIAQPGAMLEYNKSQGKPEPIPVQAVPRHIIDMAFTRPQTMREISGVNVEMTGARQASDPGVVMEMRQKAAKTVLAPMFDNHRQSKKALGMVLLAYMQTYISKGRRMRILGPNGSSYVDMTEQMQLGRYDVTVEETNSTINDRMATLAVLQTTLPQMAKAGIPTPPSIIDLLPMQPHIRDDWKRLMEWHMLVTGQMPPPDWQPGMPLPLPAGSPGMPPGGPGAPPPPQPAPPVA
ncbi:hypothetical protein M9979_12165 [Sphingomonas sp. RP10(2022)]|uniref:Portal protein n=1 Tax=Sphingomonas liriopis TaxID=2949094 RepID=A0A9X2KU60_9SPHN|nr:hypothetical protein [Sphingomonas liriopis]MCP3735628.1 hypothetical protein [Sphingomonas liriopis]